MMRWFIAFVAFASFCFSNSVFAASAYGKRFCKMDDFYCVKVKKNQSWQSLFPNEKQRDVVKRLNRMNIRLKPGMTIAVPKDRSTDVWDISPFPKKELPSSTERVVVDQKRLAWAAYDEDGHLLKWGPISGGKNYCRDVNRGCRTISGKFTFYRQQGAGCVSSKYPLGKGGAKMPWCMHFYRGYAMHGSHTVPGYHASHGCVRIFIEDAKWLNQNFLKIGNTQIEIGKR